MSTNVKDNYSKGYFKMDNDLAKYAKYLDDSEFRLLSYYQAHSTSWTFRTTTITEDLSWSTSKLERVRSSLQTKGYLFIRRLPNNEFIYYIGRQAVLDYLRDKTRKETTKLTPKEQKILDTIEKEVTSV